MIESFRYTVGVATMQLYAHPLASSESDLDYTVKNVVLINVSTTQATVFIGGTNATSTASGARWIAEAGRTLSIELEPGEAIFAVVSTGTQDIDVLVNGR